MNTQTSPGIGRRAVVTLMSKRWLLWPLTLVVFLVTFHSYHEWRTPDEIVIRNTQIISSPDGTSRNLVVLIHGYTKTSSSMERVAELVQQASPDADLFIPEYDARLFSNTDPRQVASQLDHAIQAVDDARLRNKELHYESITLLGHSAGALLARKALLYGRGDAGDRQGSVPTHRSSWVNRTDRIILLAGMNRGWTIDPAPEKMGLTKYVAIWLGRYIGAATSTGYFIRSIERGAPFVANLRIQWIRAAKGEDAHPLPLVIQLLGDQDDLVSNEDDTDLTAAIKFCFIPVPGTGHASIIDVGPESPQPLRATRLREALTSPDDALLASYPPNIPHAKDVDDIVFIVHGIRDFGGWTANVANAVHSQSTAMGRKTNVVTGRYRYFPIFSFLLRPSRQRHVRWFVDRYTEELARSADADVRISFIGHSNGTYLLASALEHYEAIRFHNVAFAGSVVRRDYPWDEMIVKKKRVAALRNDLGSDDWVVGIFPRAFEAFPDALRRRWNWLGDLGSGGYHGFLDSSANRNENRSFPGGHSAALTKANYHSLAHFALTGKNDVQPSSLVGQRSPLIAWLSKFAAVVCVALFTAVGLLGYLFVFLVTKIGRAQKGPIGEWLARRSRLRWLACSRVTLWGLYLISVFVGMQFV